MIGKAQNNALWLQKGMVIQMKEKIKKAWNLYLFFAKIGCFTFGGGWSIIAQMQEEFIEKRKTITKEELLDIISVAKSLPGIMITNISVIFGYRTAGILGAVMATLGMATPCVVILSVITVLYNHIKDNLYISYMLSGIRSSVIPIIAVAAINLWKSAVKDWLGIVFCMAAFVLSAFTSFGNIEIMICSVLAACVIAWKRRKQNGAD